MQADHNSMVVYFCRWTYRVTPIVYLLLELQAFQDRMNQRLCLAGLPPGAWDWCFSKALAIWSSFRCATNKLLDNGTLHRNRDT